MRRLADWIRSVCRKHPWAPYLILGLVAVVPRTAYFVDVVRHDPLYQTFLPGMDMKTFQEWALSIAEGDWLGRSRGVFYQGPLYPYFVALIYRLTTPHPAGVYAVQQLLGLMTCLLLFRLGERLFSLRVGFLAGLLWALYGTAMIYEMKLLLASLLAFLTVAGAVLFVRADRRGRRLDWMIAGGVLGLAVLARANLLPLVALLLPWRLIRRGRRHWKAALLEWGLVTLTVLVVLVPVTVRNRLIGSRWVLISSNAGVNFFIGNNPEADGSYRLTPLYEQVRREYAGRPVPWFWETWKYVKDSPGRWLAFTARKVLRFWSPQEFPNNVNPHYMRNFSPFLRLPWVGFGVIAPLSLLGIGLSVRAWNRTVLPVLYVLTFWSTLTLFFLTARFRLPAAALLCVFSAFSLAWLAGALSRQAWKSLSLAFLALAGVFGLLSLLRPSQEFTGQDALNYSKVLRSLGRHREAIEEGEKARAAGIFSAADYSDLATVYYWTGDLDKAAEYMVEGLRLDPASSLVRGNWKSFCAVAAQRPGAFDYFQRWSRLYADVAEISFTWGRLLGERGRWDEALPVLEEAVRLEPDQPEFRTGLAEVYTRLQKSDLAREQLLRIVQLRPDHPAGWYDLACLSAAEGRREAAMDYLGKALERGGEEVQRRAADDPDLDDLRDLPGFRDLLGAGHNGVLRPDIEQTTANGR